MKLECEPSAMNYRRPHERRSYWKEEAEAHQASHRPVLRDFRGSVQFCWAVDARLVPARAPASSAKDRREAAAWALECRQETVNANVRTTAFASKCRDCGEYLTPIEELFYESRCENCEARWFERIEAWRHGAEDDELDERYG